LPGAIEKIFAIFFFTYPPQHECNLYICSSVLSVLALIITICTITILTISFRSYLSYEQAVMDSRAYERPVEDIVADTLAQMHMLSPSSKHLNCTWSSVVKLGQSLYREKPGQDKFRPSQATPLANFFLAGSYTYQDYIDSMEGATKSGIMVADEVIARAESLHALAQTEKGAVLV